MATIKRTSHLPEGETPLITSPLIPETRVGVKFLNPIKWLVKELFSSFMNFQCQPFWQAFDEFVQQIDFAVLRDVLLHWPSLFPIYAQIAIVGLVITSPLVLTAVENVFAQCRLPSPPRWLKSLLPAKALVRASIHQFVLEAISEIFC